jgi:hypothetical protein
LNINFGDHEINVTGNLKDKNISEVKCTSNVKMEREITIKKLTVAMQYGILFLHPGQRSSHSGRRNWQKGHGVVASSVSDVSGLL